jgi:hypothetical protein
MLAYMCAERLPQVLAFSATYTELLLAQLRQLMNAPQEVLLCPVTVTLQGAPPLACDKRHGHAAEQQLTRPAPDGCRRETAVCAGARRSVGTSQLSSAALPTATHAHRYSATCAERGIAAVLGEKEAVLLRVLSTLTFNQVRQSRAAAWLLAVILTSGGSPARPSCSATFAAGRRRLLTA